MCQSHNQLMAKMGVEPLSCTNHCSSPPKVLCAPGHLNKPASPADWGLGEGWEHIPFIPRCPRYLGWSPAHSRCSRHVYSLNDWPDFIQSERKRCISLSSPGGQIDQTDRQSFS